MQKEKTLQRMLRLVVADDNRDVADSFAILLQMDGFEVTVVNDGASALSAIEIEQPDIVLLDIGLPDLDGYEVARRVREQGKGVILIAVTGWGQPSDKARALEAGFDHHFTKPVEPEQLASLLRSFRDSLSHE